MVPELGSGRARVMLRARRCGRQPAPAPACPWGTLPAPVGLEPGRRPLQPVVC